MSDRGVFPLSALIAFSGSIASGKSTLSRAVAEALKYRRVSFGDNVRRFATAHGKDPSDPHVLQDLGEMLVRDELDVFCRSVLGDGEWQPGNSLIIDGLRHTAVAEKLRSIIAPDKLLIIFVDVARDVRDQRHRARSPLSPGLDLLETHPVETQVLHVLAAHADLVIDGAREQAALVKQILDWLATHAVG